MELTGSIDRDRLRAGLLTAATVTGLGFALVAGLDVSLPVKAADVVKLFALPIAPPPRLVPPPPHRRHAAREGAAAPPNLRSKATPVVAPKSVVPPVQPPPVIAATIAAAGANATSGAAPVAGPGTGAGGQGSGTGSGRGGAGGGDGGTPAEVIRKLRVADLRRDVRELLAQSAEDYAVDIRFTVGPNGRLVNCAVTRSSGVRSLDDATCQAAIVKLRFAPERDAQGRAIAVTFSGTQEWPARRSNGSGGPPDDD